MSDTFERIKKVLAEINYETVTRESHIIDDLGLDSLDTVDFVMKLEEEFDIEIPDGEAAEYRIVGDIADAIDKGVYTE